MLFSTEEKDMLKKISTLTSKARNPKVACNHPCIQEYVLRVINTCQCCHFEQRSWAYMTDSKKGYLQAKVCSPPDPNTVYKKQVSTSLTCPFCRSNLSTLSKENLIEMLIKSYNERRVIK